MEINTKDFMNCKELRRQLLKYPDYDRLEM
jgi:hypothetical protein